MLFWVYEDDPTDSARVHKATCPHRNDGRGVKATRRSDNRWHGPFDDEQQAFDMAYSTGHTVSGCRLCFRHHPT